MGTTVRPAARNTHPRDVTTKPCGSHGPAVHRYRSTAASLPMPAAIRSTVLVVNDNRSVDRSGVVA
ncbi:hypothetical protein GCM10027184_45660 [Saccharothrix stipae]